MTPDSCPERGLYSESASKRDILAGLWQEAPFARLPPDAPAELQAYTQDIDNPKRVYAVHRASRRHEFQLLVERYSFQLRTGCGHAGCLIPTCFTYRRRLAGKSPLRRYNSTSARTLAVYLASRDNPEDGLCAHLCTSKESPIATPNSLIFSTRSPSPTYPDLQRSNHVSNASSQMSQDAADHQQVLLTRKKSMNHPAADHPAAQARGDVDDFARPNTLLDPTIKSRVDVVEGPSNKDHRSFAANLFGTVAFKMLEWLTPRSVLAMQQQLDTLVNETEYTLVLDRINSMSRSERQNSGDGNDHLPSSGTESQTSSQGGLCQTTHATSLNEPNGLFATTKVSRPGHGSTQKAKHIQSPKSLKTLSTDAPPLGSSINTKSHSVTRQVSSCHPYDIQSHSRPKASTNGCETPKVPNRPPPLENVSVPLVLTSPTMRPTYPAANITHIKQSVDPSDSLHQPSIHSSTGADSRQDVADERAELSSQWLNSELPQSLSFLNVDLVNFMCDIFEEDGTSEGSTAMYKGSDDTSPQPLNAATAFSRQLLPDPVSFKKCWKDFNDQTFFYVLGDPYATVRSFTRDGEVLDSQTLWYCLYRMNQVAPTVVIHSLWLSAGILFTPPHALAKSSVNRHSKRIISNKDAGHLMTICMHALVAVAPNVPDSRTLYELSRIRSAGLTLANGGAVARQPPSRCLAYDDAFSNELALRLARRIFRATSARRIFADMAGVNPGKAKEMENDILQPLVNQLNFLSADASPILEFTPSDRLLHETRVPTVLLDWARTVILRDWDGRPEIATDDAVGGALSFIQTMHQYRKVLLLGDIQFRVDYMSDRLDTIEMPVDWISFTSSRWQKHILDYPYVFSPETLVSFFRSINFARMSRMYEESSSLKTRMSAIVDPGSLITNPHHKMVLQDLLQTASSRYLILEISRDTVARDAFDQLWRREKRELLRPLKIHLGEEGGEEGMDSGGVQQEFFRLAIAECLDPAYGAFSIDERTRMAWFAPGSLTEEWKYELVGLLMSLALYNGLTLPITFPKALYRKLLGRPIDQLHHIADGWPDLASGLTTLLEWDENNGLVEDIFARTYEYSISSFGTNISREMKASTSVWPRAASRDKNAIPPQVDNPEEAPLVTNDNRDAYVNDYIRYLTDISVQPQYQAFERGFHACLDKKSLSLLSPSLLQSLVEGLQEIDISELKRSARYVGWDASHRSIKDFWSIVRRFDDRMKQKLLEFVTSSDRVPVGGMKNIQFVIQKNGEEEGDGGHLPTAYTCYGTLLLPEYRDKEVLRERLGMALENAQGFGFA